MSLDQNGCDLSFPNKSKSIEQSGVAQTCHIELDGLKEDVLENWKLPHAVTDYLANNAPLGLQNAAMQQASSMLVASPNIFDVPESLLPIILQSCLDIARMSSQTERVHIKSIKNREKKSDLEKGRATINALSDKVELKELVSTNSDLKNLTGRDLITALSRHAFVKPRPHLQTYLTNIEGRLNALHSLAATPEEAFALNKIINGSSLYLGADNFGDVFADVLAKTDSSHNLSESTKIKIHSLFNIPIVKTASDIQNALDLGCGIDENGKKIPYTKDNKARVFENAYVYETPDGGRKFQVNLPNGRNLNIRFDGVTSNKVLTDLVFTTQIIFELEKMSLANPIFQRGWNITHGGEIDLHFDDINTAKRIGALFLGETVGFDGQLLSRDNQNRLAHNFQAFPKKGDAAQGDNNSDRALFEYKELNIINTDKTINWTQFEKAAHYLQNVSAKGGKPDFEDLKAYLL